MEFLDVLSEFVAVLEVEFLLAAFFSGTRCDMAPRDCIVKYTRPELLVHQDSRSLPGDSGGDRSEEPLVNYLLGRGNLSCLLWT